MNEAAPLVAVFDGWGFVVSGDFAYLKFGFWRLIR